MKKGFKILIVILIILIVVAVVFYLILRRVPPEAYEVQEIDSEAHWATISGSLGYPSDYIPEMGVCAETTDKEDLYCTYEMLENDDYTYGLGYQLKVPPGKYYVFAHLMDEENKNVGFTNEEKAYHSKYVTCGSEVKCTSHKPITVEVKTREHITRIDPIDWYNF